MLEDIVYIQQKDGNWLNINCYEAFDGFTKSYYTVNPYTWEEVSSGKWLPPSKYNICVGAIGSIKEILRRHGVTPPTIMDYPPELSPWLYRDLSKSTLGEIFSKLQKEEFKEPLFVKPYEDHKLFNGSLLTAFRDFIPLAGIDTKTPVWVSTKLNFLTEWRVFILRKQILDARSYKGDPFITPSKTIVEMMIGAYKYAPVGYGLDVGVLPTGETVLIEVNDGFSLGNYGMGSLKYSQMLAARWEEMVVQ